MGRVYRRRLHTARELPIAKWTAVWLPAVRRLRGEARESG
jgi:hypothetical protein